MPSLNHCSECGGSLELVGGTDPDNKGPRGEWYETYKCASCGGHGMYKYVDETGEESFAGVIE